MIPQRRPAVEGRAAAKSSGWHGGSRSCRKIRGSGEGRAAYGYGLERGVTGGGGGGENDKPGQRTVHLSSTREREPAGIVVVEEQRRVEEEFLREQFGEVEERKRKDRGLVDPSPEPFVECILLNNEEEDGVNGGRMKPLTSFDLNRGMPPPQNRKLKIKLSSTEDNLMDEAAPKAIRRAQDKENGGLVPLCPGTTQIRGMKRKTVSPTDLKPQGGKRVRTPNKPAKTTDETRKRPALEIERDGSHGIDMLLMALEADPSQRLISPSQPTARPTVIQAITGAKAVKNARPALRVGTALKPFCRLQVQSRALTEDGTSSRQEKLKASSNNSQATMQLPQDKIKEKDDLRIDSDEDSSSSDEDDNITEEEYIRKCGPFMRPHRYIGRPCETVPLNVQLDKITETADLRKDADDDISSSDEDMTEEEYDRRRGPVMRPHRYRRGSFSVELRGGRTLAEWKARQLELKQLELSQNYVEPTVENLHEHQEEAVKQSRDKITETADLRKDADDDISSSDEDEDMTEEEYDRRRGPVMRPHRYRRGSFSVELRGGRTLAEWKARQLELKQLELSQNYVEPTVENLHEHQQEAVKQSRDKTNQREESIGSGEELHSTEASLEKKVTGEHSYCMTSHEDLEGMEQDLKARELEDAAPSRIDEDLDEYAKDPHRHRTTPSRETLEKSINQPVLKEHTVTGLNYATSRKSHQQQQHKVSEREPTGHDSIYGRSLRVDFEAGSTVVEKSHITDQEGDSRRLLPSVLAKFQGARQQSSKKELSGAARTNGPQLWNTKRRKAFCIVPKQVKLATASCLIDNGESSHPSVGAVVVECLPPSPEQKEDNRAPFSQIQNKDAAVWSSHNARQSHMDVVIWDTDKENISWVPDTASDRPSNAGVKVPCPQDLEVITRAQNDASSLHLSGSSSVRVSGSRALGDPSSGNSVHTLLNSRTHVPPAGSRTSYNSGSQLQQQQQQQCTSSTPGAGSGTCIINEHNETRHEIAGVTMLRRSWEALKSAEAEYFSKRRVDPKTEAVYDNNYVPLIPSRFQNAEYHIQGVSTVNSKPDFETDVRHGATHSQSIGITTHGGIADRRVTFKRGPKQGKQERLSTKVLNRNLENFVQLNDVSCHQGNAHFPVDVSQLPPKFPLPRSHSGLPKPLTVKTRQRGPKKSDKDRLKTVITKTSSSSCHFKSLSEPSGLLGSLNPGIIGRVRNIKQIHAMLGALIGVASNNGGREENPSSSLPRVSQGSVRVLVLAEAEKELKGKPAGVQKTFLREENVPLSEGLPDQGRKLLSSAEQCQSEEVTRETREVLSECAAGLGSLTDDLHEKSESLTHMVPSVSGDPEHAEDDDEKELQPMSVTDCSSTAAGLAARWLELLSLDAKGRLSALKRSRRRVQNTLLSVPLNPESGRGDVMSVNPPSTGSMSIDMDVLGSQQSVCSGPTNMQTRQDESSKQIDRWRTLFTNMDVVLGNEATKLESWLWQINHMQEFCPSSSQQPFSGPEKSKVAVSQGLATANPEIDRQPSQRWPLSIDAIEKKLGFAASAASIISTANFVTEAKNLR